MKIEINCFVAYKTKIKKTVFEMIFVNIRIELLLYNI